MDKLQRVEENVAHLTKMIEDLSDVIARQDQEILRLKSRVGLLMEREAEREVTSGVIPLADQRPPHW